MPCAGYDDWEARGEYTGYADTVSMTIFSRKVQLEELELNDTRYTQCLYK